MFEAAEEYGGDPRLAAVPQRQGRELRHAASGPLHYGAEPYHGDVYPGRSSFQVQHEVQSYNGGERSTSIPRQYDVESGYASFSHKKGVSIPSQSRRSRLQLEATTARRLT